MVSRTSKHDGILAGIDCGTGELKTIDDVVSGKACNCFCPHCETPLIAKKGQWMTHHFAHESLPDNLRSCQETALHEAAKIVAAKLIDELHIPERKQPFYSTERFITRSGFVTSHADSVTTKARAVERLSGMVEPIIPDVSPYRPDAKLETLVGDIFIEIHVTNPVAQPKAQALRAADLAVLEIDFSKVPRSGLSLDKLKQAVASDAPRAWVSQGLQKHADKAREQVDLDIREVEQERHQELFRRLRETPMGHLRSPVAVSGLQHLFSDRGVSMAGEIPFTNLREEKGFWLADLPGVSGVLVTSMADETLINRLFAWYQMTKGRDLTVLSIGSSPILYSSNLQTIESIVANILKSRPALPDKISSLRIVEKYRAYHSTLRLSSPLTPRMIDAMGSKAYVAEYIPNDYLRDLILSGFVDIVVNLSPEGWEVFSSPDIARRIDSIKPSGGLREHILYHVAYRDACLVRFVPSPSERLKGDVFDLLEIQDDELYLRDSLLGPIRVYYSREDYWKKGGLLIMPDPMRKGAYHLEPSKGFLTDLKKVESANL